MDGKIEMPQLNSCTLYVPPMWGGITFLNTLLVVVCGLLKPLDTFLSHTAETLPIDLLEFSLFSRVLLLDDWFRVVHELECDWVTALLCFSASPFVNIDEKASTFSNFNANESSVWSPEVC